MRRTDGRGAGFYIDGGGNAVNNLNEKANTLNKYFCSVFGKKETYVLILKRKMHDFSDY